MQVETGRGARLLSAAPDSNPAPLLPASSTSHQPGISHASTEKSSGAVERIGLPAGFSEPLVCIRTAGEPRSLPWSWEALAKSPGVTGLDHVVVCGQVEPGQGVTQPLSQAPTVGHSIQSWCVTSSCLGTAAPVPHTECFCLGFALVPEVGGSCTWWVDSDRCSRWTHTCSWCPQGEQRSHPRSPVRNADLTADVSPPCLIRKC